MATMNISLPDTMKEYVESQVETGGYSTTSEYFRALVREDQRRREKERLDALLLEGLNSGDAAPMGPADWKQLRDIVRQQTARLNGE
ncbi:MAG TPA: type II toxin-antitoxin system ParD family antitoxin [Armatimonadota bacterium]|jgi:antitoxin ParD1/3/4